MVACAKRWRSHLGFALFVGLFMESALAQVSIYQTDLGTLGGAASTAYAINSAGQMVGSSKVGGGASTHAFLYSQGMTTDLGTLGGPTSEAFGINDSGQIVGYASTSSGFTKTCLRGHNEEQPHDCLDQVAPLAYLPRPITPGCPLSELRA
jgi:probable HAF family extracellular repeat protein